MKIEKILLLSKGSVLDSSNNVLVSGHHLRMYKEIDELITSSSAVEGLGRGGGPRARWRASGVEEGAVEGHGRAQRRATGARGGGRTRKKTAAMSQKANGRRREEEARGRRCSTRKKRADRSAPGAGGYISGRFTSGASHQPGVKVLYSRCVLPTGSKGLFTPGACYQPGVGW